jgi:hypothetical protein
MRQFFKKRIVLFFLGICVGVTIVIIIAIGYGTVLMRAVLTVPMFRQHLGGEALADLMFGPEVHSDRQVRACIAEFGIRLPGGASELYCCTSGFDKRFVYVGMTIDPDEGWRMLQEYLGKGRQDFRQFQGEFVILDPGSNYGQEYTTALWDPRLLTFPIYYEEELDEPSYFEHTIVLYDEMSRRLLVYHQAWNKVSF